MQAITFSKTGTKSATKTKLNSAVFDQEIKNNDLLHRAYLSVIASKRATPAKVKTRTEVRGGGRKPWQQKGTGNARAGSIRSPLWRGGGITFGPTGEENHKIGLTQSMRQKALRQALTLSADKIIVVETFVDMEKKTKDMAKFLNKIDAKGRVLAVVSKFDADKEKAARNISNLEVVETRYLNTFIVMNADTIVFTKKALIVIDEWLGKTVKKEVKK